MYRFSQGLRLRNVDLIDDGLAASSRTLAKMAKKITEVCCQGLSRLKRRGAMRVGGRHHFVVLDESQFSHKRKYNRGRFGNTWRRIKKWVFGIMEVSRRRRKPILRLVRGRSRRHLLPIIRKYVRPGTAVLSDEWRAYHGVLAQHGYRHFTVCHKRNFINPTTGAHTQHLERAWQTYKCQVWRRRGNRSTKSLKRHLCLIEWHYWLGNRHRGGVLGRLIHDIKRAYK
ncbi:hypothetical protein AGOR_G00236520 [Albula goreensis]|uniref:ISXO2-like transposase domain-containing protein n=1 Tax=Albula goreensis TaxID=1534307 RepID=A0A8T3CFN2_9TELE|nr:hypothetical protein AGOR_G00236520 [Albula goreensis]